MTLERQEQVSVVQDQGYQRLKRVLEVNPSTRSVFVSRFSAFVWMVTIVITLLITFRFALKLIGANAASGFVSFMYGLTDIFVAPFSNIIGSPTFGTNSVFDTGSLFAVIIYLLLTWVLLQFFYILFAGTKGTRQVSTFEEVR